MKVFIQAYLWGLYLPNITMDEQLLRRGRPGLRGEKKTISHRGRELGGLRKILTPWSLFKLMSIESVMPSNHLILCYPLLLLSSIFPSISVFSSESALCIRWLNNWSFSFSISLSNEYSGLTPLGLTGLISLLAKGLSGGFSSTTIQKHQFFNTQLSL